MDKKLSDNNNYFYFMCKQELVFSKVKNNNFMYVPVVEKLFSQSSISRNFYRFTVESLMSNVEIFVWEYLI